MDKLGISGFYPFFHEGVVLAQQTHGVLSGNPLTEAKNKAEHYRDSRYTAFSTFVRSATYDANQAVSEAADRVLSVIDAIGNPTRLSDSKETAELFNLQTNLLPYRTELALIGADGRLTDLINANDEFVRLQNEWYKAGGEKPSGNMFVVRRQLDPIYRNIINCINSFATHKGMADYESFIVAHNELIVQYQTVIAQRKTRAKNAVKDNSPKTEE